MAWHDRTGDGVVADLDTDVAGPDRPAVEERVGIRRSEKHASEYARLVEDVHVTVAGDGEVVAHLATREPLDRARVFPATG